ncbi:ComEA family DNA-binding protein [Arthrobacter sp. CAN_A1]|uniref:ComEA family DNA-binding protein n=1 Tax=Arthrobacter sp. CAN_A1 TaxID=2787717 RepID=UPI001A361050
MAQHRWATSPPSRVGFTVRQESAGTAQDPDDPEDPDDLNDPDDRPPSPQRARRWAVGRGASLLVLGLTLSIAFGLFMLRGAPSPEVTSVAFDASASSLPDPRGAVESTGAPTSVVPPPGARAGAVSPAGPSPPAPAQRTPAAAGDVVPQLLLVHVAGAVARPGVVELAAGARVFDALDLAGGALPEADLAAINLAAPVQDGQQIRVPLEGEVLPGGLLPPAPGGSGGASSSGADAPLPADTAGASGIVNLNTAGPDELETLPRIGPVLAERIVQWRTDHGGFTRPEDLDAVPGIGEAMLAALIPLVTV